MLSLLRRGLIRAKKDRVEGHPAVLVACTAVLTSHDSSPPPAAAPTAAVANSRLVVFSTTSVWYGASSLWYLPVPVGLVAEREWGSQTRKESRGRGDDVVTSSELLHGSALVLNDLHVGMVLLITAGSQVKLSMCSGKVIVILSQIGTTLIIAFFTKPR